MFPYCFVVIEFQSFMLPCRFVITPRSAMQSFGRSVFRVLQKAFYRMFGLY